MTPEVHPNTPRPTRIFTVTSLAEKASSAIHECVCDAEQELITLARHILRTTPDKKAPVLRASFSVVADLRTGGAEFEFRLTRRTVYRSEGVLEQLELPL